MRACSSTSKVVLIFVVVVVVVVVVVGGIDCMGLPISCPSISSGTVVNMSGTCLLEEWRNLHTPHTPHTCHSCSAEYCLRTLLLPLTLSLTRQNLDYVSVSM